ncbi:hypothetical protein niasHT_013212 [Heterodera trifolii]|uniref:SP-RING-type domain-containing protein n=1 Tax=Heterodera trifolii TaxID=157864 RepID=A0ABD2KXH3_9BILA
MRFAFTVSRPGVLIIVTLLAFCCAISEGGKPRSKSTYKPDASSSSNNIPSPQFKWNNNAPVLAPWRPAANQSVSDLCTVELPFYEHIKGIVPMTKLPPYPVPSWTGFGHFSHTFVVPREDVLNTGYEVQLRMFMLDTTEEQQDAFPPHSIMNIDGYQVRLPQINSKPEKKQCSFPVDITRYVQPQDSDNNEHRLEIEWDSDKRAWALTINLVKRLDSNLLLSRILDNPNARRPLESTRQEIVKLNNPVEDGEQMEMDALKISLLDPLMRTRIKIPARFAGCKHLQCFDLKNYLMMLENRQIWKCPICGKQAAYSKLYIDSYFEQVLSGASPRFDMVEFSRDGSWSFCQSPDTMLDTDSEDEAESTSADGGLEKKIPIETIIIK